MSEPLSELDAIFLEDEKAREREPVEWEEDPDVQRPVPFSR
jgi:hypothetical protein